jgi:hypothetical protein
MPRVHFGDQMKGRLRMKGRTATGNHMHLIANLIQQMGMKIDRTLHTANDRWRSVVQNGKLLRHLIPQTIAHQGHQAFF